MIFSECAASKKNSLLDRIKFGSRLFFFYDFQNLRGKNSRCVFMESLSLEQIGLWF